MQAESHSDALPAAHGVDPNSDGLKTVKAQDSSDKDVPQSQAPVGAPEERPGSTMLQSEEDSVEASPSSLNPLGNSSEEPEFVVKKISVTTQSWGRRPSPPPRVDPRRTVPKPEPPAGDAPPSEPAITTEAYPWIAMASTLEACFDNADPSQSKANNSEDLVATPSGDETLSQQAVKPDAEPTVQPSDAASNASEFSRAAPEIMKSFHAHGDACNKAETDSLKLATREQPNADVEQPLQDYYDMLAHLESLQSEAASLEASITKLTSEFKESESELPEVEASARSQVLDVISACLPVLRARISNLSMAQELVDSAQENISLGLRMEQLGL